MSSRPTGDGLFTRDPTVGLDGTGASSDPLTRVKISLLIWNTHLIGRAFPSTTLLRRRLRWREAEREEALVHGIRGWLAKRGSPGAVVGLAEVWDYEVRRRIARALEPDLPVSAHWSGLGGGLLLLSNIEAAGRPEFVPVATPWQVRGVPNVDWFSGKGALFVDFAPPGTVSLRVVLTHLQSDYWTLSGRRIRAAQLATIHEATATNDRVRVVMGDLNICAATPEYDAALALLRCHDSIEAPSGPSYDAVDNQLARRFSRRPVPLRGRIDHILYSAYDPTSVQVDAGRVLPELNSWAGDPISDHHPVHADLILLARL